GVLQRPPDSAGAALAPVRALGDPVFDLLGPMPYAEVQSYLDETEPAGLHHYWKTEFLAGLDDGLLATARELFAGCPIPSGEIGILHLEGALNERAGDDGAVGNRDAAMSWGSRACGRPAPPTATGSARGP